ncbi:hypothetical protein H1C71_015127 [Ictidomys tridecemlineatus]|nr:hypothetical protein H1C71_015127 [Ictidomys tridecemlineatus]
MAGQPENTWGGGARATQSGTAELPEDQLVPQEKLLAAPVLDYRAWCGSHVAGARQSQFHRMVSLGYKASPEEFTHQCSSVQSCSRQVFGHRDAKLPAQMENEHVFQSE